MSLDASLRAELRKAVQAAREVLTSDLSEVLEGTYGIHRNGLFEPVDSLPELAQDDHRETRDLIETMLPTAPESSAARTSFEDRFDDLLRSLAFTHLNRLIAFKLMEHTSRKLIKESLGRTTRSRGFLLWAAKNPEQERLYSTGREHEAYVNYLLWLCTELDQQIGILFDTNDLASRVQPSFRALDMVLEQINQETLEEAWAEEETLGWVYQYYTPKELRDTARKQSPAPRNPYEMSFLNQFYTPDYVVRFLVDNTLGRTWYEMRGGDTVLRERCQYLVWRPDEELAERKKKQPEELRVIDPACGSGHFLLYAFDVLQAIYEEAYTDPDLGEELQSCYDPDEYARAVPALIIEHNLHGIDIDRRATQIAALALYLKARTAHPEARVERANVVCAEPMPGDRDLFAAFKQRKLASQAGSLSRILDHAWEHLELAGEVGSVLKVDEEISAALAKEKEQWLEQQSSGRTGYLFEEEEFRKPEQLWLDFSDVDSPHFWENAEAEIGKLLREYADEAEGAEGIRRRLFARDSARGLHFIEVMRKRYDVALMNPPFGAASVRAKPYITTAYPLTKNDIYAVFVERYLDRLHARGFLGAITSRTGFFLSSFQKWREQVILARSRPTVFADLGHGVMDAAMVEAAAYCLQKLE